ncbi:MAG: CBS domain-containing protein [Anaerolineae bacterium]
MTGIDQEEAETTAVQDRLKEHPISALNPSSPIVASASASLAEAIEQMNASNIGCLLVVDEEGKLAGIFTERDVLMRVAGTIQDPAQEKLADHMTADPITLNADYPIAHALHLMSVHGFRHLPLVDAENRATGIISFRDVIHYLGESLS